MATSVRAQQAFWIVLLPFALANVAGWAGAHRRPGQGPRPTVTSRLFALTLTLLTVVLSAAATTDLLAIQCGSEATCREQVAWLAPQRWGFLSTSAPLRIVVAGSLVLLLLAGLRGRASRW